LVRKALEVLTPSLRQIAEECGLPYNTVRAFQRGEWRPAPAVLKRLVAVLRRHGAQLTGLADELERAAAEPQTRTRRKP